MKAQPGQKENARPALKQTEALTNLEKQCGPLRQQPSHENAYEVMVKESEKVARWLRKNTK